MPPPPAPIAARDDPFPLLLTATPAPAFASLPTPTLAPRDIEARQASVVTVSVTTTGGGAAPSSDNGNKFPVAVAVPALVGGMALAFLIGGLWWWIAIKRDKEKKRAWEASQRRRRRRAESAAARKAEMSRRNTAVSAFNASKTPNMSEKDYIPPVPPLPTLPKAQTQQTSSVQDQYASAIEEGYNHYSQEEDAPAYDAYGGYSTQPSIEPEYGASTGAPPPLEEKSERKSKPERPSRSTARMAAAENAAARESADPNTRWKPNKPSRFAKEASPTKGAYGGEYDQEETLAEGDYGNYGSTKGQRKVSGEWGVALGSPNNDGTFSNTQPLGSHYLNDPYLNQDTGSAQRAPSGQYSTDPYAAYHDPTTKKTGGGWV